MRLLSLWPKDALRPNQSFTKVIEYRGAPYGVKPLQPLDPESSKPSNVKAVSAPPAATVNSNVDLANINALYSLLDNRYSKKYPLSPDVLKPTSNPKHYERLMEEIERAPTKSWWQAKLDEWKMKIRFR